MNQLLLSTLINIAASMFFGIVSNWIYDLLRDSGLIPDRPNLKVIVIILLVSLTFVVLSIPEIHLLDRIIKILRQQMTIYFWLLLIFISSSFFIGYFAGQKKSKNLLHQLQNKERQLNECERRLEQSNLVNQHPHQNGIINPE
jgi:hypothetical protein